MIRLGKKYEIASLRDEGLARLKREFPTTLEEYDRLPGDYTNFKVTSYRGSKSLSLDILLYIVKLA